MDAYWTHFLGFDMVNETAHFSQGCKLKKRESKYENEPLMTSSSFCRSLNDAAAAPMKEQSFATKRNHYNQSEAIKKLCL